MKLLGSLGQTAEQFGETADQTAEQFCLETLLFLLDIVWFSAQFQFVFSCFLFQKNQEYEKETTE